MDQESTGDNGNSPNANPKRKKPNIKDGEEANPDRLSELPEPLLVNIISLLDMKDAVKTGVLSKKWENIWTHVDSIVIALETENEKEEQPKFFSFVDNVLMHCNCPNIKKFQLCFYYDGPGKEILLKWVQCVFKKNVEFLKLQVYNVFGEVPEWFFHNSSLVKLEIEMLPMADVYFDGAEDVQWLDVVTKLLQSVQNVKEVTIGPVLIQALSVLKLFDKPSPLFNCKHLTACLPILKYDLPGMASLLQSSPHLETLSIKVLNDTKYYFKRYFNKISGANEDKFLCLQKSNFQHLKKVTVIYAKDYCTKKLWNKERFVYELVEYIQRNAQIEKLVITSEENSWCRCSGYCALRDAYSFSREALHLSHDNATEWNFRKTQSAYEIIYSKAYVDNWWNIFVYTSSAINYLPSYPNFFCWFRDPKGSMLKSVVGQEAMAPPLSTAPPLQRPRYHSHVDGL
ncbi:hypothetical protein BUALT_Bualt15G0109900 [Buddleja alternifolia]|uniref:F-box domain-containing protein n=1 Tax=Buddleja alternifolia TaxID=168488 RepID=A0AAV6WMJ3_9LAMI|nr:hypothetical protein BUALT_Bualt15G0109900 [Buddleja alternifolia]